jgi:hypothetical protein
MSEEKVKEIIKNLREIDLSIYPIDKIVEQIRQIRWFPVHATEFHVGNVTYRVRPNEDNKSFKNVSDLSYKPEEYNKTFQRASSPGHTMFYGSIIPLTNQESELNNGRVIAASEGSKLFRDTKKKNGQEIVTFGMWRFQDTASLATILHPQLEKNISPFAIERAREFMQWLKSQKSKTEVGKLVLEFYAEEFAKLVESGDSDYNYLHSAVLTDFLVSKGLHGVCYPSTRTEGKGINVAISPEFVDAHMRLEGAMECIVTKYEGEIFIKNSKIAWVNAGETELKFKEIED